MSKGQKEAPSIYSPLPPRYTRIFRLDDGLGPLSGILMPLRLYKTSHSSDDYSLSVVKRIFSKKTDKNHDLFIAWRDSTGFDALSYSWTGSSEPVIPLELRTYEKTDYDRSIKKLLPEGEVVARKTIAVAKELSRCLLELRRKGYHRWLWVDAICINQDEIRNLKCTATPALPDQEETEFARHAPLMNDIYGAARTVLIWVGELDDTVDHDLKRLGEVTRQMGRLLKDGQDATDLVQKQITRETLGLPSKNDSFWTSVASTLRRRWWTRLWTLQEVVLAESGPIITETGYAPIDDLLTFIYYAISFGISPVDNAAVSSAVEDEDIPSEASLCDLHRLHRAFRINRPNMSTQGVLHPAIGNLHGSHIPMRLLLPVLQRRNCNSCHQEDKVYGALGLMNKNSRAQIRVQKGADPVPIYVAYATQFVTENEHPGTCILNYNHQGPERLPGLPSWCPDLSKRPLSNPLCEQGYWACVPREGRWESMQGFNAGFDKTRGWMPKERKWKEMEFQSFNTFKKTETYRSDGPMQPHVVEASEAKGGTVSRWSLQVTGAEVDRVIKIVPPPPDVHHGPEWEDRCYNLFRKNKPDADLDLYSRTLIANAQVTNTSGSDGDAQENSYIDLGMRNDTSQYYRQWKKEMAKKREPTTAVSRAVMVDPGSLSTKTWSYIIALNNFCPDRSFFVTSQGRIGLGPGRMSVGDKVCIFFLCPTSYIIREDAGRTVFVGETYVHGLMHGEALSLVDGGMLDQKEWFIE